MTNRVVVSGATGFIGAAVVRELLARGRMVTVLLRADSDTRRLQQLEGFDTVLYDRQAPGDLVTVLRYQNPATFIHCAWRGVSGKDRNDAFQMSENVPMTLAAVDLAVSIGCSQWIGLGSQAEYGNQNRRLAEDAPLQPTTSYGEAKLLAGTESLSRCSSSGLAGVWLRVFSTYGPGDSPDWLIPYVIREFLADREPQLTRCEQMWDFLYISDAARAIVSLADGDTRGVFNLGSGTARALRTYVEAARREVGTQARPEYGAVPYRADQVMHLEADISRLVSATGWRPEVDIPEGMRTTVAFERRRAAGSLP